MGETKAHKYLKNVGIAILLNKGCNPVGTEVSLPFYIHDKEYKYWQKFGDNRHHITDVAGIVGQSVPLENPTFASQTKTVQTLYCIEVKVSRSDFRNGFCMRGWGKMWLLSPPNVIPPEEIPDGVGHYECDIRTGVLTQTKKAGFSGMEADNVIIDQTIKSVLWSGYVEGIRLIFDHNPEIPKMFGQQHIHPFVKGRKEKPRRKKSKDDKNYVPDVRDIMGEGKDD